MKQAVALVVLMLVVHICGCGTEDGPPGPPLDGTSGDTVDAADTGLDPDLDAADPRPDAVDADTDDPGPTGCPEKSYIWISNSAEGTLSKLCTINGVEMGRYVTSPQGEDGDPSRTSVNLFGDMVVTNRSPSPGPSSVTKFAAERIDCVDRNGDTSITTSSGPDDVLPWGEDECMIWNTPLPVEGADEMGCRATAWDGDEDPDTGVGGRVWIGCAWDSTVYVLDGDTGSVLDSAVMTVGPYGGAMDGSGSYWMVDYLCIRGGTCTLSRLDMATMTDEAIDVACGYGISVDGDGRVWTAGMGCVSRYDPVSRENLTYHTAIDQFNRGVAVDDRGSVWAAVTSGDVLRVAESDVSFIHQFPAGPAEVVGVAVDFHGYVWAVSQGGNAALKIDPDTYDVESFDIGEGPYTYSDMTGYQLSVVEIPF